MDLESTQWIQASDPPGLRVDLDLLIAAICGRQKEREFHRSVAIKSGSLKRRNPFRSVDGRRNTTTERPNKERKRWRYNDLKSRLPAALLADACTALLLTRLDIRTLQQVLKSLQFNQDLLHVFIPCAETHSQVECGVCAVVIPSGYKV